MIETLWNWISAHEELTALMAGASLLMLVGSVAALPFAVRLLPADYFCAEERGESPFWCRHPAVHILFLSVKNLIAILLFLGGLAMLVLPGQGLLTLLVAMLLLDFPGKYRLERRLVSYPRVINALNWLRARTGCPPLRLPPDLREAEEQAGPGHRDRN